MDDPFESPKLLLARAKENAAEFRDGFEAYGKSDLWEIVAYPDLNTGEKVIKAKLKVPLPLGLRGAFSDAVNNLRHALDQSVNSGALEIRGGQPNCYFPFGRSAADFALIYASKRYKTVPPELRPYIEALKPYGGGDDLLYALNRITGPNKHQAMLRVEPDVPEYTVSGGYLTNADLGIGEWDRTKNELPIARIRPGGQFKMNLQFGMSVLLGGGNAASGEPALGLLDAFIGKAESIVLGIEAETARVLRERGG